MVQQLEFIAASIAIIMVLRIVMLVSDAIRYFKENMVEDEHDRTNS